MDEALKKSGDYPNIALTPGTHVHAATGEPVEIPASARMDGGTCDIPFCEQVDRWLHGDAPSECRECADGKYAELTALVDNTCTLKPLTPFATALMGILEPEWGVCSACGSATPKVGSYCAICGAHIVEVVDA